MRRRIGIHALVVGSLVALSGCGGDTPGRTTEGWDDAASRVNGRTTFLAFRSIVVDSILEGCDPAGPCTRATLALVTFPDAPPDLQDVLHGHISELMGLDLGGGGGALTPWLVENGAAEVAHEFLEGYRQFRGEFPDAAPAPWFVDRRLSVLAASPDLLTLSMEERNYTGGAHGNARLEYRTLSPVSGSRLLLDDLLDVGFEEPLRVAGEAAFREARGLNADEDLVEAGFTFGATGEFALNENFAPAADGLRFHFDAYEISAYAAGPTDFTIPWSEIAEWVLPEGPLASFIR